VGLDAAITHVNELESRGAVVTDINKQIALEAGRLLNKYPDSPIADALLAASATFYSAEYIVTNDDHFEKLGCKTRWI
jgi:predicted nucleic acid-binding protein